MKEIQHPDMKIYFTMVVLLIFCLSTLWGNTAIENQDRRTLVPSKITTNCVSNDSLQQNMIHINCKENVVSINNTKVSRCDAKTVQNKKKITNTIDINGEANSVNINQNGQSDNVTIQQNGNANQVNLTQSKSQD